jgi:hypothetical protein
VQEFEIEKVYVHPKYMNGKAYYDIAVIIITPVSFTPRVRPICLPESSAFKIDKYDGVSSTLIGWGNSFHTGKTSSTLKRTILTIYDYRYYFRSKKVKFVILS